MDSEIGDPANIMQPLANSGRVAIATTSWPIGQKGRSVSRKKRSATPGGAETAMAKGASNPWQSVSILLHAAEHPAETAKFGSTSLNAEGST